jgi:hypothetical protein
MAVVKRGDVSKSLNLVLPANWRSKSDISRRASAWSMRGMATGGLVLEDLAEEERARRALATDKMALFVKNVGQYGKHAAAKNAGFQKEDVIVELDGRSDRITEGEMMGHLLQKHQPGEKVRAVVLRGEQRLELTLPMQ